jgi:uncharacterized NAD(P)/FAD-binding protein YdhS
LSFVQSFHHSFFMLPNLPSHITSAPRITIAIIGAGFCGTMAATHLLRARLGAAVEVVLINRPHLHDAQLNDNTVQTPMLARGLAYGTNSSAHLLNVPAARMSAFEDKPTDFLNFLQARQVDADAASFVARHWYGKYLQCTLDEANANANSPFHVRHQTVEAIHAVDNKRYQLKFGDGEPLSVDYVVLALGNFLPTTPHFVDAAIAASPHYIRDPWQEGALDKVDVKQPILLIGTGLTMFDLVGSLSARADAEKVPLQIHALSRRGLWPQPHRPHLAAAPHDLAPPDIASIPTTRAYLRSVRAQVNNIVSLGGDWRDVVASMRPITPMLWRQLPLTEKKRFIRHVKPYWESHRHRAAPAILKLVDERAIRGEIVSNASRILDIRLVAGIPPMLTITHQPRNQLTPQTITVATIINCTGPSTDIAAEPLLCQLAQSGLIRQDELKLGIEVAADYRVINADAKANHPIYYVGPLLKARDWEATAVPELRLHVAACVKAFIAGIGATIGK